MIWGGRTRRGKNELDFLKLHTYFETLYSKQQRAKYI